MRHADASNSSGTPIADRLLRGRYIRRCCRPWYRRALRRVSESSIQLLLHRKSARRPEISQPSIDPQIAGEPAPRRQIYGRNRNGAVDPAPVGVLRFNDRDENRVTTILHYACH